MIKIVGHINLDKPRKRFRKNGSEIRLYSVVLKEIEDAKPDICCMCGSVKTTSECYCEA